VNLLVRCYDYSLRLQWILFNSYSIIAKIKGGKSSRLNEIEVVFVPQSTAAKGFSYSIGFKRLELYIMAIRRIHALILYTVLREEL